MDIDGLSLPDRYRPDGTILKGGMSSVLPCIDLVLERKVAIKVLSTGSEFSRVQDEIKALQKIRSNHVVQIYDIVVGSSQSERVIGIVEEYLQGVDLTCIDSKELNAGDFLKIIFQISSGLSDIHEQGLVHRDIKPTNMKYDQEGLLKIFDFGLTRIQGLNSHTQGFKGTPCFAAPELCTRGHVFFTEAVDVYAFGITILSLFQKDLPEGMLQIPPDLSHVPSFREVIHFAVPDPVIDLLDLTLDEVPDNRPKVQTIRDTVKKYLLSNRHRAIIATPQRTYSLEEKNQAVRLSYTNFGQIEIVYNGLDFKVLNVSGSVFINNTTCKKGDLLPGSCVITLGDEKSPSREFFTVDISHPEVVI
ncbi:serine/threonine-protein kinase [Phormidium tenue]|uniref:Protein kinase domain-containing protein n=1 Tax=Phormidium tenue NIES-30 TaxID=549789 RepID=A0A1U7J626_9CYAN|nr:serine/threonine-protein kinase [Phormidium tenue]MBD2232094.1 serine/threonine protein kinase [Phormidium tenue FACHB-1052]OKH48319.1 hypothetical protein NIES30_09790 [Phormidium tenue NIES-30]